MDAHGAARSPLARPLRWRGDMEPRARRPATYGWSIGDLKISIAGVSLTSNMRGAARQQHVSWYLLPIADWLAQNWGRLLHEEEFAWTERSAAPAATVVMRRMHALIDARDAQARRDYALAQEWRNAHALSSAASGGLLPDLFLRRYLDTIELSWTASEPLFAPDQFRFTSEPGLAYLSVEDVAAPLWDALQWLVKTGSEHFTSDADAASLSELAERLDEIQIKTVVDFTACRIGHEMAEAAAAALQARGIAQLLVAQAIASVPAITRFSPAVAMFGGLSPNLSSEDVGTLSDVLANAYERRSESPRLTALVYPNGGPPVHAPIEGHDLALELLDDKGIKPFVSDFVNIDAFLKEMGVAVLHRELRTETIRGVSLAGENLAPTIVVNTASAYNQTKHGVRFTLAHELAHLIYDRSMATSVGISSGPWAPAGVEKRANAFAAMLLMPRWLVLSAFGGSLNFTDVEAVADAAEQLHVSMSALVEHLANLNLIDDYERELMCAESKERVHRGKPVH